MRLPPRATGLKYDNKGSAIVTVIVSVVFIMALGAALLFLSYMAYKVSRAQREDTETFYMAESAVDDIRFGLQTEATRALSAAYTQTMAEYSRTEDPDFDPQTRLALAFRKELFESAVSNNIGNLHIFSSVSFGETETARYMPAALSAYVKSPESGSVYVGSNGSFDSPDTYSGEVSIRNDAEGRISEISLLGVSLKYIKNGVETRITTDITISTADFYAKPIIFEGLNSYALVANGGLIKDSGGESLISGKVYSGGIEVSGAGNSLKIVEGDIVSPNGLSITHGATFSFLSPENDLWAGEISASDGGSVRISGRSYIADDLLLGKNSSAHLEGLYFGFGSFAGDPDRSSAIIANGKGASLDISALRRLSLAGVAFIDVFGAGLNTAGGLGYSQAIPMGESLTVKSNQLAYLVPTESIQNYSTNPYAFNESEVFAPSVDMNARIWTLDGQEKNLNDYLGGGKGEIKALYKNMDGGDKKLAYVFLLFSSQNHANKYFRDYFEVYPDRISEYLKFYLELSDKGEDTDILSAGNTFFVDGKGTLPDGEAVLTLAPATTSRWSGSLQARFDALSSPLSHFANMDELHSLPQGTQLEFFKDGELSAIVINGDFSHSSSSGDTLRLILATGDVSISGSYTGIILSEGKVSVSGGIRGRAIDGNLLSASCRVGEKTYYLSDFIGSGLMTGEPSEGNNPWAPDKLVQYENWSKN